MSNQERGVSPLPWLCELCGRPVPALTRHHLIPRTRHRNKRTRRSFDVAELRSRIIWLCRPCHSHVHDVLDEKQLATRYNTQATLRAHPEIIEFVRWIGSKPAGFKPKGSRRRRRYQR